CGYRTIPTVTVSIRRFPPVSYSWVPFSRIVRNGWVSYGPKPLPVLGRSPLPVLARLPVSLLDRPPAPTLGRSPVSVLDRPPVPAVGRPVGGVGLLRALGSVGVAAGSGESSAEVACRGTTTGYSPVSAPRAAAAITAAAASCATRSASRCTLARVSLARRSAASADRRA